MLQQLECLVDAGLMVLWVWWQLIVYVSTHQEAVLLVYVY